MKTEGIILTSDTLRQRLLFEIQEGIYSGKDALPPEIEVAENMGVSRNLVRECLTRLEREGWITRKQGVGTLINKDVVNIMTRLDLNFELCKTLELSGKKAEVSSVKCEEVLADSEMAKNLQLEEGHPLLRVARLIKGDGKPAIYCIDYFDKSLLSNKSYDVEEMKSSIYDFMQNFCGVEVVTNLTEIRSMPVTEEVANAMDIPLTCSLLHLSEIGYDIRSKPILYSIEYYIDRMIRHMIVRKKI